MGLQSCTASVWETFRCGNKEKIYFSGSTGISLTNFSERKLFLWHNEKNFFNYFSFYTSANHICEHNTFSLQLQNFITQTPSWENNCLQINNSDTWIVFYIHRNKVIYNYWLWSHFVNMISQAPNISNVQCTIYHTSSSASISIFSNS